MSLQMPVRVKSLVAQLVEILTERIKSGVYARESQIPSEHQLSTEFDVSRATIRSAIRILVERQLLAGRRGVGTFVTSLNQLNNPLHEAEDFDHLIRNNGSVPSVSYVDVQLVEAEEYIADVLQLEPGARVLRSYKIFSADDQPVIYCKNMIPVTLLGENRARKAVKEPRITEPLFYFLEEQCGERTEYQVTRLRVEIAANSTFPAFPYQANVPVLILEDTGYNLADQPIWHSINLLPDNLMHLELFRPRVRKVY